MNVIWYIIQKFKQTNFKKNQNITKILYIYMYTVFNFVIHNMLYKNVIYEMQYLYKQIYVYLNCKK